jgi:molybdopterin-containing oxidoreductase family iron-sulfur binding subunit
MVIDLKRCIGCDTCTAACKAANQVPLGILWNRVFKFERGSYPNSRLGFLPVNCMHCDDPECVRVCPTGASYLQEEDGLVLVDSSKCMGCKYCILACPYGARNSFRKLEPFYDAEETPLDDLARSKHVPGVVQKCDFCQERIEGGLEPACVVSCVGRAKHFGDLDDPTSTVSRLIDGRKGFQLNPELGTNPSLFYLPDY